jgi:hypothetical protein
MPCSLWCSVLLSAVGLQNFSDKSAVARATIQQISETRLHRRNDRELIAALQPQSAVRRVNDSCQDAGSLLSASLCMVPWSRQWGTIRVRVRWLLAGFYKTRHPALADDR